jgi:hypothetical protein
MATRFFADIDEPDYDEIAKLTRGLPPSCAEYRREINRQLTLSSPSAVTKRISPADVRAYKQRKGKCDAHDLPGIAEEVFDNNNSTTKP